MNKRSFFIVGKHAVLEALKNPTFYEKLQNQFSEKILTDSGLFYFDEKKKIFIERTKNRTF